MNSKTNDRRGFLHGMLAAGTLAAAAPAGAQERTQRPAPPAGGASGDLSFLPAYTRAQSYKSLKQSSYDTTGGNSDRWPIAPGGVREVFKATGAGALALHTHGSEQPRSCSSRSARHLDGSRSFGAGGWQTRRCAGVDSRRERTQLSARDRRKAAPLVVARRSAPLQAGHRGSSGRASGGSL